jgi:hypothetical protein
MSNPLRGQLLFKYLILLSLSLAGASACATNSQSGVKPRTASARSDNRPEITDEKIRQNIVGKWVYDVPAEDTKLGKISWRFEAREPKEFSVLEKSIEGDRGTIVIDMKTGSWPGAKYPLQLSGKLRLHYELQSGWVTRRWEIVRVENLTMKYRAEQSR